MRFKCKTIIIETHRFQSACECPENLTLDTDNSTCIANSDDNDNFGQFLQAPCLGKNKPK